jgi:Tfp pilus assembly protein PilF
MQAASAQTVLGDFDGAALERRDGDRVRFTRAGDAGFAVRIRGADEKPADFPVAWSFGVDPLQQYLVALPDGRLQALPVAWDARPRAEGGQRWLDLQPDESVPPGDALHWTGLAYGWNSQCAACHSTDLRKGYDAARDRFDTRAAEHGVACEACHGPASRHVAWADAGAAGDRGLVALRSEDPPARWVFAPGAPIARREPARSEHAELETCAPCHARRSQLAEGASAGTPLFDAYRPSLLEPGLYHVDGQILDEVYELGSFLQSRMHAAGVTCSDCHEPHALELRAEGNALCAGCHAPAHFDAPTHHHHEPGSAGAQCAACHMPARTYMQVDVRHDHSFRVPRPDLTVALGVPNACAACHAERPAAWAAEAVARWFPDGRSGSPHWGSALATARGHAVGADAQLAHFAEAPDTPPIVRGSLLAELADPAAPDRLALLRRSLAGGDPWVALGALAAAERLPPRERLALAAPLLRAERLALRVEAARALADVPEPLWSPAERRAFERALAEYRATQETQAERPEARLALGVLALRMGDVERARREYESALRLAPWFVPAAINLADLERALGRDAEGEAVLRRALELYPGHADLHHALGLLLVRTQRPEAARAELARAAELAPEVPRYAYAHALALLDAGERERALELLARAQQRAPGDRDLLIALATLSRDAGRRDDARRYARALVEAFPDDTGARELLASLEAAP